jgi:hypothetical protein
MHTKYHKIEEYIEFPKVLNVKKFLGKIWKLITWGDLDQYHNFTRAQNWTGSIPKLSTNLDLQTGLHAQDNSHD